MHCFSVPLCLYALLKQQLLHCMEKILDRKSIYMYNILFYLHKPVPNVDICFWVVLAKVMVAKVIIRVRGVGNGTC